MSIKPINSIDIKLKALTKPQKAEAVVTFGNNNETDLNNTSSFGESKVYSDKINALKQEINEFKGDIDYRKNLMLNASKDPDEYYKLRSIIGLDEIKSVMKDFNDNENFYSVGENDINIKNKNIRANLHIHTQASDGFLTTRKLLDDAVSYANEVAKNHEFKKEPFIIAITDHDTTESTKEAIDIISKDPIKYRNLRVILGVEITTYNNIATNIVHYPTNTHVLVYGIDPNEKSFNTFIESTKKYKNKISLKIIKEANKVYQKTFKTKDEIYSLEEAKDFFAPLKKDILGIYNYMNKYLETKITLKEVILKNPMLIKKMEWKNLSLNADSLMSEIKSFYYEIDKNNKPRSAAEFISTYLSQKLEISPEEISNIVKKGFNSTIMEKFNLDLNNGLEKYKRTINPKSDYMPTLESLYKATKKQNRTIIGLAHPLETVEKIKDSTKINEFIKELYKEFKSACKEKACFSEFYYQSYNEKLKNINNIEIKNLLNTISNNLNLFKTGSADSHGTNIFKRLL